MVVALHRLRGVSPATRLRRCARGGTDAVQLLILVASALIVVAGALELGGAVADKLRDEAAAVDTLEGWAHEVPAADPTTVALAAAAPAPAALPRVGERVVAALEREHADRRGVTWNASPRNQLAGDWILETPGTDLHAAVYDAIAGARRSVTISTLAPPDEPYLATIDRALRDVAARQRPGDPGVDVRILIGDGDPAALHRRVTDALPAGAAIRVAVGLYAGGGAWNHSKVIAADGERALVGGHNWWARDYDGPDGVHDLSIRVRGDAARHAEDYVDGLWAYAVRRGDVVGDAAATTPRAGAGAAAGDTWVIAVGTQGGASITADATSDTALHAMLDAATRTIRISQQDLVSMDIRFVPRRQHLAPGVRDRLAAALDRGVRVEIVVSGSAEGGYANGWSPAQVRAAILARARTPGAARLLDLRAARDDDGAAARNHAKVVIVDDEAVYVGSQNLYPGGMAETLWLQLAELGYVVADPARTREVVDGYWRPLWQRTR